MLALIKLADIISLS